MTGDDSLPAFMAMLASIPATLAVVLINTHSGYELSQKLTSGSDNEQGSPVPMLVVGMESGSEIVKFLREHERDVEAKVELVTAGSKSYPSSTLSSPSSQGNVYVQYIHVHD